MWRYKTHDVVLTNVVPTHVLLQALAQAAAGRAHILQEMQACSPPPARSLSRWAPKVAMLSVPADKLGALIGPVSGGGAFTVLL